MVFLGQAPKTRETGGRGFAAGFTILGQSARHGKRWFFFGGRLLGTKAVAGGGDSSADIAKKLAEIPVGLEPRCVAVHPNDG
jgi:hypothetical protein